MLLAVHAQSDCRNVLAPPLYESLLQLELRIRPLLGPLTEVFPAAPLAASKHRPEIYCDSR